VIVSEASPAEKAQAEAIRRQQMERFSARLRVEYSELTANLLQDDTLDPGDVYGGRVSLKSRTLDVLRVTVTFAGKTYSFAF
jgi:hypothetical protein